MYEAVLGIISPQNKNEIASCVAMTNSQSTNEQLTLQ